MYVHVSTRTYMYGTRPGDCRPAKAHVPKKSKFDQMGLTTEGSNCPFRGVDARSLCTHVCMTLHICAFMHIYACIHNKELKLPSGV